MSAGSYGWHQIDPHCLTLEGAGASLEFVASQVLGEPSKLSRPDAIGLTSTLHIERPNACAPLRIVSDHAFYGSLAQVLSGLTSLRNGQTTETTLSLGGMRIRVYQHAYGPRSGLCVTGDISDLDAEHFPWPQGDVGDEMLLERRPAFGLKFGFLSSLVDPPYLDRFCDDIATLVAYLSQI